MNYIFTSNSLQESVVRTGIQGRFLSDQSPVAIKISISKELQRGLGLSSVNSLLQHENVVYELKNDIKEIQTRGPDNGLDDQMKWHICKFSIVFSKSKITEFRKQKKSPRNKTI